MSGLSNAEIASILDRYGIMLQLAGESPFRARAYSRAAESIRATTEPMASLLRDDRLQSLPGVGQGLAAAIAELVTTGAYQPLEQLEEVVPGTLIELLSVPGVGLKTAIRLYQELEIADLESLAAALASGQIEQTKGFGKRTANAIAAGLESVRRRTGRLRLGTARPIALELATVIQAALPTASVSLAGSVRRWDDTVADIDLVVGASDQPAARAVLASLPAVSAVLTDVADHQRLRLQNGIEADIFWSAPNAFGSTLVRATGNAAHWRLLGEPTIVAASETDFYAATGLPWIPPELRQGAFEVERADLIHSLIRLEDVNGEFHCHTTWSDGSASVDRNGCGRRATGICLSRHLRP